MKKHTYKLTLLVIIIAIAIIKLELATAYSPIIPGETEEEITINREILKSDDETFVFSYLNDPATSVRLTACMRLQDIGTSYSLSKLEGMAVNDADSEVKEEASFAVCKIRYREDIAGGGSGENVLLSILGVDAGVPITAKIKGWAMEVLGDIGSQAAILYLNNVIANTEITYHTTYFKEIAKESLTKIQFIANTAPQDLIELGLINNELCVRKWALRRLVEQNRPDLQTRLEALLEQSQTNNDYEFAFYIASYLEAEIEKNRYPALEIEWPQDGITVKSPSIDIIGSTYGEPFHDVLNLTPGENTYTKTITDRYSNTVTKSIKIYYNNNPPVLNLIGNKEVLTSKTLTFVISASDPDDTELLYFAYDLPEGATFDHTTQAFSWTPTQTGIYVVTFEVDDGWGLSDEESVVINVKPANTSSNLITNPYMEQGITTPLGWYTYSNDLTTQTGWVTDAYHSSSHSLKIVNTQGKNAGWYGNYIYFSAGNYPTTVTLGGYSKAENVSSAYLYCLDFYIKFTDGTSIWYFPTELRFSPGTHDWEHRYITKSWGKPIVSIKPYCLLYYGAKGTVWFDDVYVHVK